MVRFRDHDGLKKGASMGKQQVSETIKNMWKDPAWRANNIAARKMPSRQKLVAKASTAFKRFKQAMLAFNDPDEISDAYRRLNDINVALLAMARNVPPPPPPRKLSMHDFNLSEP